MAKFEGVPGMDAQALRSLITEVKDGKVSRVGDSGQGARVDVRIVTGTTRDLQYAIATGSFRADLFYRLNVLHFVLPPRPR